MKTILLYFLKGVLILSLVTSCRETEEVNPLAAMQEFVPNFINSCEGETKDPPKDPPRDRDNWRLAAQ